MPYWEAWFLESGTLTVSGTYTVDAWGIGGGSTPSWGSSGGSTTCGKAGIPNMITNIAISGSVAVTIGAGGRADKSGATYNKGGDTLFGDYLTCAGGEAPDSSSLASDSYKRYRFEDPDKANEAGASRSTINDNWGSRHAQGGWLKINRTTPYTVADKGAQGDGFGGGGGYYGYANQGALVIRIKI